MNIVEATQVYLLNKGAVRRPSWKSGVYLKMIDRLIYQINADNIYVPECNWTPTLEDITAEDYEEYNV